MENKLKEIIGTVLGIKASDVSSNTSAETIETWDSLKHLNLIVAIEEEFDIQFEEEEIIELMSYDAIKKTLEKKL